MRYAILGLGAIGKYHAQNIKNVKDATLTAYVDPYVNQCTLNALPPAALYDSVNQLNTSVVDSVIVCTPPNTHSDLIHELLDKGLNVLCEKPFVFDVKTALEIISHANRTLSIVSMASKFVKSVDIIKAKSLIDEGMIGEPVHFRNYFYSRCDMSTRWNSQRDISGGGVIMDNGPHSFDIARYLLGSFAIRDVLISPNSSSLDVEDNAKISLKYDNGATGIIELSWASNHLDESYLHVIGTKGAIKLNWASAFYTHDYMKYHRFGNGYNKSEAFVSVLSNFQEQILFGSYLDNSASIISNVAACEQSYKLASYKSIIQAALSS